MKHKLMKKITTIMMALTMLLASAVPAQVAAAASGLGALADSYSAVEGTYTLNSDSRILIVSSAAPTGELLETAQLIQRQIAADTTLKVGTLELIWGEISYAQTGDIVLNLNTEFQIAAEGYQLTVADTATVTASDVDGLLYGANMLQKYFRNAGANTVSGFTLTDAPDTKERTVMLDCGRKYYTKEWICNFIRQMSWMGYNTIELHFSEDGGFRADFWDPSYYKEGSYKPANDFSWICGSKTQYWVHGNYTTDPDAGKYLTTQELVEILKTAKEYHLDVIPSFDSPSHMDYLCWQFEQYYNDHKDYSFTYGGKEYKASDVEGCINFTGTTGESSPTKSYKTIDIRPDTVSRAFVLALYEDIAAFFKEYAGSTEFSIGADEVVFTGGNWGYEQFVEYVNTLNTKLKAKGYKCRMFNDFIGSKVYNKSASANQAKYDFDSDIEIMYWDSDFNPYNNAYGGKLWDTDFFVDTGYGDGGRTLYNCIQTNCYYVLRVHTDNGKTSDARNPENRNWTFYRSTEEGIYDGWYPADFSEKGVSNESKALVPTENLGGAYFLIWNDYAALSTEAEVWNGATDKLGAGYTYKLIDRMWSNTMKMWNWDINSSVTYTDFAAVRDTYGYFPGFTSCSAAASLPAATNASEAYIPADHTALTNALANKISNETGIYTAESYAAYEAVYQTATEVNANPKATEEELAAQVAALANAKVNLKFADVTVALTVYRKAMVDGQEVLIDTIEVTNYELGQMIYLKPLTGYTYQSVDRGYFVPLSSGDGSGYLNKFPMSGTVTVWYESVPDTARLNDLIAEAQDQGAYTEATWSTYSTALTAAKNFEVGTATKQADIDSLVKALEAARDALAEAAGEEGTKIYEVEKLTESAVYGKQVGLRVTTTADATALTVDRADAANEEAAEEMTLTVCTGRVQTLTDLGRVKVWYVTFPADAYGSFTYTVHAGTASAAVTADTN